MSSRTTCFNGLNVFIPIFLEPQVAMELLYALLVLLVCFLSAQGLLALLRPFQRTLEGGRRWRAPAAFSVLVCLIGGLGHAASRLGLPVVVPFSLVFYAFVAYGAYAVTRTPRALVAPFTRHPVAVSLIVLLLAALLGVWWNELRVFAVFPSFHDGAAHATFYSVLKENDTLFMQDLPAPFASVFGNGRLNEYPIGVHFIFAILNLPFVTLGNVNEAIALKGNLIAGLGAAPLLMAWTALRFVPRSRLWHLPVLALILFTYYPFPFQPLDSGGVSRLMAVVLAAAFTVVFLDARRFSPWHIAPLAFMYVGAFFFHPALFSLLAFLGGGIVFVRAVFAPTRWRQRLAPLVLFGVTMGVTGALLAPLLGGGENQTIQDATVKDGWKIPSPYNGIEARKRVERLYNYVILERKIPSRPPTRPILFFVGLGFGVIALWTAVRSKKRRARALLPLALVVGSAGFAILMVNALFVPLKAINLLGYTFYFRHDRVGDVTTVAMSVGWAAGLVGLSALVPALGRLVGRRLPRPAHLGFAGVCALACGVLVGHLTWVAGEGAFVKLRSAFAQYHSMRDETLGPLRAWLNEKGVSKETLIVGKEFETDLLPLYSGHPSFFRYGECPNPWGDEVCQNRKKFAQSFYHGILLQILDVSKGTPSAEAALSRNCVESISALGKPFLVVALSKAMPSVQDFMKPGMQVCKDLTFLEHAGPYMVFKPLSP